MIYIDNLVNFIKLLIDQEQQGVFYPQNSEYVSTYEVMRLTRIMNNKKVRSTKVFNWLIKLGAIFIPTINKVYGNKYYELNNDEKEYETRKFHETVRRTMK